MNRINQKGMTLIQFKIELMKDYPQIVRDSLKLALGQMAENKVVDIDTYHVVLDESVSVQSFEEYLKTKPQFLKTEEEIFQEFEAIRSRVDEKLSRHELSGLQSESVVDKDIILVFKKFCINESFTMRYFGVEEKDLLKLMKRRGFVEKFSVLRLTAIFKPFVKTIEYPKDLFVCDVSLVYYDKVENGYSIDLYFELPVEEVEKEEKLDDMCLAIKDIVQKAEGYFASKTVA